MGMQSSDNRAFKEWASVCRALGQGRQILILRKGGIAEGPRGFEVTDRQFFLYPTYLHQSASGVIPEWRSVFEGCVDPAPGKVSIGHYAVVSSWRGSGRSRRCGRCRGSTSGRTRWWRSASAAGRTTASTR